MGDNDKEKYRAGRASDEEEEDLSGAGDDGNEDGPGYDEDEDGACGQWQGGWDGSGHNKEEDEQVQMTTNRCSCQVE